MLRILVYGRQHDELFAYSARTTGVRPDVKIFTMASVDLRPSWVRLAIFFDAIIKVLIGGVMAVVCGC
jgi:hypothetical protein